LLQLAHLLLLENLLLLVLLLLLGSLLLPASMLVLAYLLLLVCYKTHRLSDFYLTTFIQIIKIVQSDYQNVEYRTAESETSGPPELGFKLSDIGIT
jgi:hypothetical protein